MIARWLIALGAVTFYAYLAMIGCGKTRPIEVVTAQTEVVIRVVDYRGYPIQGALVSAQSGNRFGLRQTDGTGIAAFRTDAPVWIAVKCYGYASPMGRFVLPGHAHKVVLYPISRAN